MEESGVMLSGSQAHTNLQCAFFSPYQRACGGCRGVDTQDMNLVFSEFILSEFYELKCELCSEVLSWCFRNVACRWSCLLHCHGTCVMVITDTGRCFMAD